MGKHERRFLDFIQKHVIVIGFFAVSVIGLYMRYKLFPHKSYDWSFYLAKWLEEFQRFPGISGIGQNIGNYNVPYTMFLAIISHTPFSDLFEVKILSVLFDYIGSFAIVCLLSAMRHTKLFITDNLIAFSVVLFTPVVFLNSAYWAQCDFMYVTFLIFCMYFIIKEKHVLAMICFGLAFALKLQAIFFLPVIIVYYFCNKKMKFMYFLLIPAIYIITALPAVWQGRGIVDTFTVYLKQTSTYEKLSLSCPNFFYFIPGEYESFSKVGISLALVILGVGACILIHKGALRLESIVLLAVWSSMVCIYFLPAMHERYPFLVCVFGIIWGFICHKDWWIVVGINLVCTLSYAPFLFGKHIIPMEYLAVANLVFLLAITIRLFRMPPVTNVVVLDGEKESK